MHNDHDLDEVAAKSAVACWFGDEGNLAQRIQTNPVDKQLLDCWLKRWGFWGARSNVRDKMKLRDLLERAKPELMAQQKKGSDAHKLIDNLMARANKEGVTEVKLRSLIAKFGFSCQPMIFAPRDSKALKGLRSQNCNVDEHSSYENYMKAFMQEKEKIVGRLTASGIVAVSLPYLGQVMHQQLFEMRTADKRLMLDGKFSKDRMKRDYWDSDFGDPSATA